MRKSARSAPARRTPLTLHLGDRWWYVRASDGQPVDLLFTENEHEFRADRQVAEQDTLCKGRHQQLPGRRPKECGQRRAREQARRPRPRGRASGRHVFRRSPLLAGGAHRAVCRFRRHVRHPDRRGEYFLQRPSPDGLRRRRATGRRGRPLPACSGRNSTTTTTSGVGSRATPPSRRRPRSAGRAATRAGRSSTTRTSS